MMPPNEYGKRYEPVYSDGTKVEIQDLGNLEIGVAPSPPYVPQSWLKLLDVNFLIYCQLPRKWKWHRIMGWKGKTAYRPRHRQRLWAWGMIRRGQRKREAD